MENKKEYNPDKLYDVVVVGGGPAGITAALYLARAKYKTLVIEKEAFGGQITITHEVVNYPGIAKVSGKNLTDTMRRQAEGFGAEFLLAEALGLDVEGDVKCVHTTQGDYWCFGILIATGAHPRTIGFKGEEEYKGRGVAYCATCDGEFFTGKEIFVIGGGYAAGEESVFLTKFASHVTILVRGDDFTCAAAVADPAKNHDKITVLTNTVVEEVKGESALNYIRYKNVKTGEATEYRAKGDDNFGVFVFVGYSPDTSLIRGIAKLDEQGYVITDETQMTSVEGVYAAGDVCIKPLRQIVTATGEGALAATELEKYVASVQRKTGLRATPPIVSKKENAPLIEDSDASGEVFTDEIKKELKSVFSKMERNLMLELFLDERPLSLELEGFIRNLAELSEKLSVRVAERNASTSGAPFVRVSLENGDETGIAFHGVPSGHEFTSFILSLYNASGPGQKLDEVTLKEIKDIKKRVDMMVLVSLSCTMCPDLVVACQKIAAENENVRAEVFDILHFEELRKKYNVMSVPCLVINDNKVSFGKKNIKEVIELINKG